MPSKTTKEKESIARILANFVHRLTYADLPEEIRNLSKSRILDVLSCAYAGRNLPHSRTAVKIAQKNPGNSLIIGFRKRATLLDAIMANSVMAHSILQEDQAFMGHPGTMIIPVTLAVGEREKASGKDALAAIVAGYEVMGRTSMGVYPMPVTAFRPGPIMGAVGASATAARLMRLNVEEITHALGYGASLAPGVPNECWWGGKMDPMFEAGVCARIGVLAATLAKGGATAAPFVFEGKHGFLRCWAGTTEKAEFITQGLGQNFVMSETIVKPYPACGINQLPIQAALPLAGLKLRAQNISRIVEKTHPGGTSYAGSDFSGPFTSQFQAQMSMQFCAAATILGRPVHTLDFYARHYDDTEVNELAQKVELCCEEGRTKPRLEVYTVDGRVCVGEEEEVNMNSFVPSQEKMEEKFRSSTYRLLSRKKVEEIIHIIRNMEELKSMHTLTAKIS